MTIQDTGPGGTPEPVDIEWAETGVVDDPDAPGELPPEPLPDDRRLRRVLDLVVVAGAALFVFWQLHPGLLLAETTPAGGDMGAHVWGFGFLRDTLLPGFRLSGWTPDWYAGFPAFQFYMVVPFLGMVALNSGITGLGAIAPAAASLVLAARAAGASVRDRMLLGVVGAGAVVALVAGVWTDGSAGFRFTLLVTGVAAGVTALVRGRGSRRRLFGAAAVLVAVFGVALPFGPSFKLVSVAGVVAMPVTAYVFGRLARLPHPAPALLSVGVVAFLFDTNFTIYGGNIASTMAGEFAFSISLALALAYLGVLVHGLRTGTHRATAAVLLALVGLCHLIPAFFALAATAVFLVVHLAGEPRAGRESRRTTEVAATAALAVIAAGVAIVVADVLAVTTVLVIGTVVVAAIALVQFTRVPADVPDDAEASVSPPIGLPRTWWLVSAGAVSALLASWWVLPFFVRRTYLNDMGWEKIAVHSEGEALWTWFTDEVWSALVTEDLAVYAALALVGAVLSAVVRSRIGVALVVLGLGLATAFVYAPQGRLWNARLLPFWYLVVYLLAAIGVAEIARALGQVFTDRHRRPRRWITWVAPPVALVLLGTFLGGQLRNLPGGRTAPDGSYEVFASVGVPGVFSLDVPDALTANVSGRNFVTDWSRWNYRGYERKEAYPEYRDVVATMSYVGETRGCGRSLWEYSPDLNDYGTPMALMLLPHWTDGCIGSMEGLYFEASSTTPFHFLVQSELSASPSRAQRDMPYRDLDVDAGVEHLQVLGVRYYLARSAEANTAARSHPDLTEVATSGPWVVYEVADAPLVESVVNLPVVTTASEAQAEWLGCKEGEPPCPGVALDWFQDATKHDVPVAATGPDEWARVDPATALPREPVDPVTVSDIATDDDEISFRVDEVGTPVLVKASYFPNWRVDGGDGPYRVAPNLMLVVPTDEEVTLRFARTPIDLVAVLLTLVGLGAAIALARAPRVRVRPLHDAPGTVGD